MPRNDDPEMLDSLYAFIDALGAELNLDPPMTEAEREHILGLTGVAAHAVVRPAAPFAALAVGYLVGSGRADSWGDAANAVKRAVRAHAGDPA